MLSKFYLTFGQNSPLKDGWITVIADDEISARRLVIEQYGQKWSGLYNEKTFLPEYFPKGELGVLSK